MSYASLNIYNFCSIIIDVLLSEKIGKQNKVFDEYNQCFLFVKNKIKNSSTFIKIGIIFLTIILNYIIYFRFGRGFAGLNLRQKKIIYYDLQSSHIGLKRDLLKFYKSFIVLYMNKS